MKSKLPVLCLFHILFVSQTNTQICFSNKNYTSLKPTWQFDYTFTNRPSNNVNELEISEELSSQDCNVEQERYLNELLETIKRKQKPQRILFEGLEITPAPNYQINQTKDWTVLIYIAGDNDLYRFAIRNLQQLQQLGSNEHLNIVVHFDFHQRGKAKETRRFFIKKNELLQIEAHAGMNSGDQKTLTSAATWAIKNFPSKHFGLVLWNHGSGDLNPVKGKSFVNPSDLFYYDKNSGLLAVDRNIEFINFLETKSDDKGICFDDSAGDYLDDDKLANSFKEVTRILGKKIDLVMFDACLMAGIGTFYLISPYVDFTTASEEVVLGPGYNYYTTLKPLTQKYISPQDFTRYIAKNYVETYGGITQDYTQSAINLKFARQMAENLDEFAKIVLDFTSTAQAKIIKRTLKLCCTKQFDEPSYIDIKDFYLNTLKHAALIRSKNAENKDFFSLIKEVIKKGLGIINNMVIENVHGKNFKVAGGVYVYLPEKGMHSSFERTMFGRSFQWAKLIRFLNS